MKFAQQTWLWICYPFHLLSDFVLIGLLCIGKLFGL